MSVSIDIDKTIVILSWQLGSSREVWVTKRDIIFWFHLLGKAFSYKIKTTTWDNYYTETWAIFQLQQVLNKHSLWRTDTTDLLTSVITYYRPTCIEMAAVLLSFVVMHGLSDPWVSLFIYNAGSCKSLDCQHNVIPNCKEYRWGKHHLKELDLKMR